jgi:molybdopterin/thiamine biosynthesis adenylyltransferase
MNILRIAIIGLGGIGSILVDILTRFMTYQDKLLWEMVLIDGDDYEAKNNERQFFMQGGTGQNKAAVKVKELNGKFFGGEFIAVDSYINPTNIKMLDDYNIIFSCVDNHKVRNWINEYCKSRKSVYLFSGGNEFTDGNVQVYIRKENKDITADLARYHPEIGFPTDKSPEEMSCEELHASGSPQLLFTNLTAATIMLQAFYKFFWEGKIDTKSEIYFDILDTTAIPKIRKVTQ